MGSSVLTVVRASAPLAAALSWACTSDLNQAFSRDDMRPMVEREAGGSGVETQVVDRGRSRGANGSDVNQELTEGADAGTEVQAMTADGFDASVLDASDRTTGTPSLPAPAPPPSQDANASSGTDWLEASEPDATSENTAGDAGASDDRPTRTDPARPNDGSEEGADGARTADAGADDVSPPPAAPTCGCAGSGRGGAVDWRCTALRRTLRHRYSFDGSGPRVIDRVGASDGTAIGATFSGDAVILTGGANEYVDLPNDLLRFLTDVTIEIWMTWDGGDDWQRLFDFGSNDHGEGQQGTGTSYFYFAASSTEEQSWARAAIRGLGGPEEGVSFPTGVPIGTTTHVAVVFDDRADVMVMLIDGERVGEGTVLQSLADVVSVNNWLGRSQFDSDPNFRGSLDEVRVYAAALDDELLDFSFCLGPDAGFYRL